jgi:hypothetical protein
MLREIILNQEVDGGRPHLVDDAKWLINRADELSHARNDALHAPLYDISKVPLQYPIPTEPISPNRWRFNPRAISLARRRNLLDEFNYCRDTAIVLADYANEINRALINTQRPWPDKPQLPTRKP